MKPPKQAVVSFWYNGTYRKLSRSVFKDRASAIKYVKAYYPSATKISVVFFVPFQSSHTGLSAK